MPYTLKLTLLNHDLAIKKGKFSYVAGSDEVRQRIKVALWHELGEYFVNVDHGIPWHSQILGGKLSQENVLTIIRNAILDVPGVRKIATLGMSRSGRRYSIDGKVEVQRGASEVGDGIIDVNGVLAEG